MYSIPVCYLMDRCNTILWKPRWRFSHCLPSSGLNRAWNHFTIYEQIFSQDLVISSTSRDLEISGRLRILIQDSQSAWNFEIDSWSFVNHLSEFISYISIWVRESRNSETLLEIPRQDSSRSHGHRPMFQCRFNLAYLWSLTPKHHNISSYGCEFHRLIDCDIPGISSRNFRTPAVSIGSGHQTSLSFDDHDPRV